MDWNGAGSMHARTAGSWKPSHSLEKRLQILLPTFQWGFVCTSLWFKFPVGFWCERAAHFWIPLLLQGLGVQPELLAQGELRVQPGGNGRPFHHGSRNTQSCNMNFFFLFFSLHSKPSFSLCSKQFFPLLKTVFHFARCSKLSFLLCASWVFHSARNWVLHAVQNWGFHSVQAEFLSPLETEFFTSLEPEFFTLLKTVFLAKSESKSHRYKCIRFKSFKLPSGIHHQLCLDIALRSYLM